MELNEIREQLDKIDGELVVLLAKRLTLVQEVAQYKLKNNLSRYHPEREKHILENKEELGKKHGLREKYVTDIFKRIIEESHFVEKKIMGE